MPHDAKRSNALRKSISDTGKNILPRSLGLFGTTSVGVGAIVGGGVLAMSGVAFVATGPGAVAAFALNGVIAVLTALSFAEMAAAFPESGGTYTFAKKVLSAPAAFMVGWVVWFASIVATVLYALGFAFYAATAIEIIIASVHRPIPFSIMTRGSILFLAAAATIGYSLSLIRKSNGGGQWATWGKIAVFAVIIIAGFWRLSNTPFASIDAHLHPFFANGTKGFFLAMGYTFIALQGFDLIAAVAGEIKNPAKNVPMGMLLSLGIALAIYLPLLFVVSTVGIGPGQDIVGLSQNNPETIIAVAARNYLGTFGFWLVLVAAILAMLSALRANLLAASRISLTMARDRSFPRQFGRISRSKNTPIHAIILTMIMVTVILFMIPDVAAAGAAASLIFLVSFALAHWTAILTKIRTGSKFMPFSAPWFPATQVVGGTACIGLAIFQGIQVPSAGLIGVVWLGIGIVLYLIFFAQRTGIVDASTSAIDPQLHLLRGRSPLVLVPIVNPTNAEFMVSVATAMAPPSIGRVLLLSVVKPPDNWQPGNPPPQLINAQSVLEEALTASFVGGLAPQALITVSPQPWLEIIRVASIHRCESLLLGLSDLNEKNATSEIEKLMSRVDSDVVVLRAADEWKMSSVKKVLVPVGGGGGQDRLRARLLGSLQYMGIDQISFLRLLPETTSDDSIQTTHKRLKRLAEDEGAENAEIIVARNNRPVDEIIRRAAENDLLILGLQRLGRRRKVFGDVVLKIARDTTCGLILINRKG